MDLNAPRAALLLALLLTSCGGQDGAAGERIVWREDAVEVHGAASGQVRDLTIHTEAALAAGYPPLAGQVEPFEGGVRFIPAFPLAAGQTYIARWRTEADGEFLEARHRLPGPDLSPEAEVTALYPSDPALPANVLRLYLHFSHPMNRGEAARHVRLLRLTEEGQEVRVEDPFVAPDHELWNPRSTRLTLLFDPGRIKQGVGPHEALGAVLEPGSRYRLEVSAEWRDARGVPLRQAFQHTFATLADDRQPPTPDSWRLAPPEAPGAPLAVTFEEPLDHALLYRLLTVEDPDGGPVQGAVEILGGERQWRFQPAEPWAAGQYRLRIDPALEDPSGNRMGRPFDAPVAGSEPAAPPAPVVLNFRIAPPGELQSHDAIRDRRISP